MADKPLWRQAFDRVDRAVAPTLEGFVQTSTFADAVSVSLKLQADLRARLERQTRRLWHAANLPAGSDVTRLREQVAALDRQLRLLTAAIDDARKDQAHATASTDGAQSQDTARHGQPRAARGRAQRPSRP